MPSKSWIPGLSTVWLVLLVAVSRSVCSREIFPVCRPGRAYWSPELAACTPCTKCAPKFTLSPCAVHKDAICGPLSAFETDWSFLSSRRKPDANPRIDEIVGANVLWPFPEAEDQRRKSPNDRDVPDGNPKDASGIDNKDRFVGNYQDAFEESRQRRTMNGPTIPWDWQSGALVLAVCACILFFLVAGCSALIYVRQWRRMKRNFEPAGLEEISARLNLMVKAELAELTAGAPMNPGDPETRCQYLEKLLDRKRETPVVTAGWPETVAGNLYIDEGQTKRSTSKSSQIARIHRNIESILSHKANRE